MRIFVSAAVVVCALTWPAVAAAQGGVFGIKGGLVVGDVSTSGVGEFDTDANAGPAIGGFAGVTLTPQIRLQAEVLFSNRRFSAADPTVDAKIRSRGVEVPVLFVIQGRENQRVRPMIYAGPQFSFISTVTQTVSGVEVDMSDRIKDTDAGVTAGGGLEVANARGAFVIDARAIIGLRNLNEDTTPSIKSRAFMMLVGYRF
jgi:hypothetical protein